MKSQFLSTFMLTTMICLLMITGCQKELDWDKVQTGHLPVISTTAVTHIDHISANSGGTITTDGGSSVSARGVCWDTLANPVTTGNHTTDGTGTGSFASSVTGLSASTTYYLRAYATNSNGTAYGNEVIFTTSSSPNNLPTIITAIVSAISSTIATCGGHVIADGGSPVTARGVCWSTSPNPVVSGNHTNDGNGLGAYSTPMSPLNPATTYYVRAYATNSTGTAYGAEMRFTTNP